MRNYKKTFLILGIIGSLVPEALAGDLISFVEKPKLFNTGDVGRGANHYRPRWSADGKWLAFEIIDENSLRTFVAALGTEIKYECRGKSSGAVSGGLDLFSDNSGSKIAVTRLSWAKQPNSNTSMFCFTDDGILYKSNAYLISGKPALTPPKEFLSALKMGDVGMNNGILIPEFGYVSGRGQAPVIFTDNDSGDLYAITETQELRQMTFSKPSAKITDSCAKFRPSDNHAITFVRTFEGNSELYIIDDIVNPQGSARRLLSWEKSDEFAPTWSPDGKLIAFYSNNAGDSPGKKTFDLYVLNPATKDSARLLARNVRPDNIEEKLGPPYIGPQWMGNNVIIFSNDDNRAKDPLMCVELSTGAIDSLPLGTILNDSPSICDLGDGTYLLAYTTFGKSSVDLSMPDITNKIYYAKMIFSR
jgi:hypothetical protein